MPFPARVRPRRTRGKLLLAAFLTATLALSGWLGYQAVDAAGSHRRTAEGVLRDYAGVAASEYARTADDGLDDFLDQLFDDVPRRVREERLPPPTILAREMDDATRDARCECSELVEGTWYFRLDLDGRGSGALWPDTLPGSRLDVLARRLLGRTRAGAPERSGVMPLEAGPLVATAGLLGYSLTLGEDGSPRAAYGVVMDGSVRELMARWYRRSELLPAAIAGSLPNDSLVSIVVLDANGTRLYESPVRFPDEYTASDTLPSDLGALVVRASVRPDAAEHLIIGGLPRSRLPLLSTLLLLTLGLGIAALVQVHREHQLERLRDDFVSGVSHEFRTPLTQIRVFAELLEQGKLETDEERRRSMAVINREARRLTHLVENVLRFSSLRRVEDARDAVEEVELRQVIDEVLEAFSPLAHARRVHLEARIEEGCRMRGSRTGIHQMLTNLLDNALKYGPDGQRVVVAAQRSNGSVRISVQDEGPGIPLAERERIWEPYRRLEKDVAGTVRGSGLGLAVVAELAERHGGRAWVEDADGGAPGGRFVVELAGVLPEPPPNGA